MADDSEHVPEYLDFYPADAPRGMLYYNTDVLTDYQKAQLKEYKLNIIRENQDYLRRHPEVKIIVQFLLKGILKARPKIKLTQFLAQFLVDNFDEIKETVDKISVDTSKYYRMPIKKEKEEIVTSGTQEENEELSSTSVSTISIESYCEELLWNIVERIEESKVDKSQRLDESFDFINIPFPTRNSSDPSLPSDSFK